MSGPTNPKVHRRLAAILAADVVGFSVLMSRDEEGTLAGIKRLRQEVIEPKVFQLPTSPERGLLSLRDMTRA